MTELTIRTHVGRDILHSAQMFRTAEAAIWEYVVNSLQYVDAGVAPQVQVNFHTRKKTITISDNGRGMNADGLVHFFTMHAENLERRRGVPGRGKFGTGKSAAFGIGKSLTVDTVCEGRRNVVYVDRTMIENAEGAEVPIEWEIRDEDATGVPSGTTITIGALAVSVNRDKVVRLIERYLAQFRSSDPSVYVEGRRCDVAEPATIHSETFTPSPELASTIGAVTLTVKVATAPLDDAYKGIGVTVGAGNLVAVETAGVDGKEFGNRLFGEVDVPELDNPAYDPVAPYGSNRDLRLNPEHPVALALITFIGATLEQVRQRLVSEAKDARKAEEMRRLAATAGEIASALNEDLASQAAKLDAELANVRRRTGVDSAAGDEAATDDPTYEVNADGAESGAKTGDEVDGTGEVPELPPGEGDGTPTDPHPNPADGADLASDGDTSIAPTGSNGRRRPRGGLTIEYVRHGAEADRSEWDQVRSVIEINLDHPVIAAALSVGGDSDPTFRRLSYEVAFTQYALAMAQMAYERDEGISAEDALYEMREALRRVWSRATGLYLT